MLDGHIRRPVSWRRTETTLRAAWGGRTVEVPSEDWSLNSRDPLRDSSRYWQQDFWLWPQHEALPGVAQLARCGRIECFETPETQFESMGRAALMAPYWKDVPVTLIPAARERAMWWGALDADDGPEKRKQEFLDGIADERYQEMVAIIGRKHQADCLHLLSAERAGLDAFLTMDHAFQIAFLRTRKLNSAVRVLTPIEMPYAL